MSEMLELRQVQQKFIRHSPGQFSPRDSQKATEWLVRWVRRHSEGKGFAYQQERPLIMRDASRNEWQMLVHVVYAYLDREGEWPVSLGIPEIARGSV